MISCFVQLMINRFDEAVDIVVADADRLNLFIDLYSGFNKLVFCDITRC